MQNIPKYHRTENLPFNVLSRVTTLHFSLEWEEKSENEDKNMILNTRNYKILEFNPGFFSRVDFQHN